MFSVVVAGKALLLVYVIGYYALNLLMIVVGAMEIRRQRKISPALLARSALESGKLPAVSVVVPAFNEAQSIRRTLASLLRLGYPEYEVIVVNDGSDDATLDTLTEAYDLRPSGDQSSRELVTQRIRNVYRSVNDPRLRVVDKRNGGKADALNAGINQARYPLVLAVDADVIVDRDALIYLALPFVVDGTTVASSGMIRPQNGCDIERGALVRTGMPASLVEGFQVLEYLRAYGVGRLFFNRLNAHLIISGAFGLFSRRLLIELGGYQPHAIGEDIELVVRIHRHLRERGTPYKIEFSSNALCLTEAPHSLRELGRQRTRWHQGLLSTLRLYRSMAGRTRYGAVGLVAFPYFLFELLFPLAEAGVWVLTPALLASGLLSLRDAEQVLIVTILAGTTVSLAAIALDTGAFAFFVRPWDPYRLMLLAILEPLGYRQCTVYFRVRTFVRYYRGVQLRTMWRPPERRAPEPSPDEAG